MEDCLQKDSFLNLIIFICYFYSDCKNTSENYSSLFFREKEIILWFHVLKHLKDVDTIELK